ncbi:ABC-2 type transporter [Chloroherpeton thalassium ATCC 35110]|uniref:Transport permease protein n=1 Tax=Chloroherpeton thalassium (strain ATCC 35110 / GB-78) TaxID=517418 RepID=B3QXQ4_CHLT3|nr:ABC transporter permease [Chloroherpeton thalassium]ACF14969.1 ABC-2 type transporter [Chloroherpeton thalassium ATCC 35110]
MNQIVIDSNKRALFLNIKEILDYKELLFMLAYRDLKVRYAQTFLGLLWAAIQPVSTLVIFTIVFSKAARVDTGTVPYPIFALAGMSAWGYFSFVLSQAGNSLISSQHMVKKIYFPRLIIPISKALVGFVDFFVALIFLVILMLIYQYPPSLNIVWLPVFFIITVISGLAVGIWMSALTIRYRDFQHILPFLVQFGLYATPIAYPANLLTGKLPNWALSFYYLNPMAGVVEGFRWSLIGGDALNTWSYLSFLIVFFLFVSGLYYFKSVEKVMADIV